MKKEYQQIVLETKMKSRLYIFQKIVHNITYK